MSRIIERVAPELIILAGVKLTDFADRYAPQIHVVDKREIDSRVKQTILWAGKAALNPAGHTFVVSVASASQFGWMYDEYDIPGRIRSLWSVPPA